jgi:hypothetical protein
MQTTGNPVHGAATFLRTSRRAHEKARPRDRRRPDRACLRGQRQDQGDDGMPTIALTNCVAVKVYPVTKDDNPPENITVNISGGPANAGNVVVHSPGGQGPVVGGVPAGTPQPIPVPVPGATDVWVHYIATSGGPTTIEVEVAVTKP